MNKVMDCPNCLLINSGLQYLFVRVWVHSKGEKL